METAVRNLGVKIDDILEIAEMLEVFVCRSLGASWSLSVRSRPAEVRILTLGGQIGEPRIV